MDRCSLGGKIMEDKSVVAKFADLTEVQATQLMAVLIKSKQKYAPDSRGTIASGKQEGIHSLLHMRQRILPGKRRK